MEGGGRGCCCGPQAFTSGVLGALACLLVTGGVFLAFHRWDPLWLVVSAVGALLALVGSLLHCCAEQQRPAVPHKGGPQPMPAAVLPEQLVPLSNARSVSQLSLNMLPGYFPPVVAAYGIEQHSAVVQNIVGQQQQRGARLLLLSLPDHTPQASLHSLVAAVYQLDGNVLTDIPSIPENNTPPVATPPVQLQTSQPVFKHVEVQTTTAWPTPSQPSTSLNLLDCSAPICDTLPPTDQVLIPLRQEALVSTRAAPDAQPEFLERPTYARVSSGTTEVSVSTETVETQVSPSSSVSTNTQVLPRSSRTSSTRVPSESRRSSVRTRRSTRSDARRPSAPADMQTPSTSSASTSASRSSEPTTQEQIPTRSDVQASSSSVTNVTSRMADVETPGTSRDAQTALKSSDVPSYSNSMRNETPSTSSDVQCYMNTNAQESVRSSNVQVTQERPLTHTEVPTTVQTSSRPSEGSSGNLGCSLQMPELSSDVPASASNESFVNCPISSEVPPEVQVSSNPGASQDNVTPIHCRAPAAEILVEVPLDIAPNASTSSSSSSSVLIDIVEPEPSTSVGLNSERLLDESLLGAVGGASSELSLSDLDEAELMERSSPPPSYDDVTHERDGSFALAYGTI